MYASIYNLLENEKTKMKGMLDSIPPYFCMAAEGTGAGNGFIPSTIHMVALMDASQIEPME